MRLVEFSKSAKKNNIAVIIAGAGGSAHLPGMVAAITDLPVIGVPMETKSLKGLDSLLSIVQMPFGIPVGTVAIGETGAKNAALYAASILSLNNKKIANNLRIWRNKQTLSVKNSPKK
jgi:5-(carboxyamino)imidazole ribonucleotide mutase